MIAAEELLIAGVVSPFAPNLARTWLNMKCVYIELISRAVDDDMVWHSYFSTYNWSDGEKGRFIHDYLDRYFSVTLTTESKKSRGEFVKLRVTTPEIIDGMVLVMIHIRREVFNV